MSRFWFMIRWVGAHDELIAHFVHCYGLLARATCATSLSAVAARVAEFVFGRSLAEARAILES